MTKSKDIIENFEPTALEDLSSLKSLVKLLKRHDTKFVLQKEKLNSLLERIQPVYKILEIEGKRVFSYKNLYFDTDEFLFYQQHHNRKLNRHKLRCRQYVDSELNYWEVKFKNNKRKTLKDRFKQESLVTEMTQEIKNTTRAALSKRAGINLDLIKPKLWVMFSRITFSSNILKERITVDTDIMYRNISGHEKTLEGIVVAEVKQADFSLCSPFIRAAKEEGIYPKTFSKYCTGIALLEKPSKVGRFKRRIMNLEKLSGGY